MSMTNLQGYCCYNCFQEQLSQQFNRKGAYKSMVLTRSIARFKLWKTIVTRTVVTKDFSCQNQGLTAFPDETYLNLADVHTV